MCEHEFLEINDGGCQIGFFIGDQIEGAIEHHVFQMDRF